ncbi:alpha/beta hydrolase [Streptomyces sp. NBC_00344]|uniref:alpha/beta hydrolase n=1 Tax=Streptomyces sp. NBC_00344 TaxID=2975720 RepID=UPI002E1ED1BC
MEVVVRVSVEREKVRFISGGTECAAWHYPGTNGACVVMAAGFAIPKEPGTDLFAERFSHAGFSVLAFDFRRLGESGGRSRQVVRLREQLADWQAAIAFAADLPEVDPPHIAVWSFSLIGGQVLEVAALDHGVAAAIAQTPITNGRVSTRQAMGHSTPYALLRLAGRGVLDGAGSLVGRRPLLVPTAGKPGAVALLTTPDAMTGPRALDPENRYPDWQQTVAARSALRAGSYSPGRHAASVTCPLLVVVCDQDQTALPGPAVRAAQRAPRAEVVRLPGGHYAPFTDAHEQAVDCQLAFLRRNLLEHAPADPAAAPFTAHRGQGS